MRLFFSVIVVVVMCIVCVPTMAQTSAFVVSQLQLVEQSTDAATARTTVFAKAQSRALNRLIKRLMIDNSADRVRQVRQQLLAQYQLSDLIKSVDIRDEQTTKTSYRGTFRIAFNEELLQSFFNQQRIAISTAVSRPLLVVPLFEASEPQLWNAASPWFKAWQGVTVDHDILPLVMPSPQSAASSVSVADARNLNIDPLLNLAANYQTSEAAVVTLRVDDAQQRLHVVATRLGSTGGQEMVRTSYPMGSDGVAPALLQRIAQTTYQQLLQQFKQSRPIVQQNDYVAVRVNFKRLADWQDIQKRVGDASTVKRVEVVDFARGRGVLIIHFSGDIKQLQSALAQQDLMMQTDNSEVVLRRLTGY